jgi:hypothetical protein
MTENWYPEADPNRDRSMPLWPELPAVPAPVPAVSAVAAERTGPLGLNRLWARRLATAAAAVVLSLGGGAVVGAAAVRLETDTVAVAGLAPSGRSGAAAVGVAARSGAAAAVGVAARSGAAGVAGAASVTVVRPRGA